MGGSGTAGLRAGRAAKAKILGCAAGFNVAYLMLGFLVPLYAHRLGYSLVLIGLLAALPSMIQLPLRALSGGLSDVWGERLVLRVAFSSGLVAALILALAPPSGAVLVAAQLAIGCARGLYWVPIQSYIWRLPGDRVGVVGLLISVGNAGSVAGILVAGPLALVSFPFAFAVSGAIEVCCLVLAFSLPVPGRSVVAPSLGGAMGMLWRALGLPVIWFCGLVSVLSAISQALVQSFYPVYIEHLGHGPAVASAVTSLRSVGMVAMGFAVAWLYRRLGRRTSFEIGGGVMVAALVATSFGNHLFAVAAGVGASGVASGMMSVLTQVIVAEASTDADRGTHLAVVNVFFAAGMIVVPLIFGAGAAAVGFAASFGALGAVVAVGVAVLSLWWRRAGWPSAEAKAGAR